MQTDAEGDWFWQISVTSDTSDASYIATWERDEGIWPNPDEAMVAATARAQCRSDVLRPYLDRFTTFAEFSAPPTTVTPDLDGDGSEWGTDDETAVAAYALCQEKSGWDWTRTVSTATDLPNQKVINISREQMGPGSHTLFIVGLDYPDDFEYSKTWPDGGWSGYGCLPTFTVEEMTVAVAYPSSASSVLPGPVVGKNTAFDASIFSGLALPGVSPAPNASTVQMSDLTIAPPVVPLLITIALTLVFAILIALPSALLESTIENNESRIGAFLKKILPPRRTAPRAIATARITASESDM